MSDRHRRRWSDSDRYWGPFTYAHSRVGYRPLALVLSSADDDGGRCQLRLSGFGHTLIVALPDIIKPCRTWVDTSRYEWANAGDGYWQVDRREFGPSYSEGLLQIHRGRKTHDSATDRTWSRLLPWTQWRHVRHSFYGLRGEHISTIPDTGIGYLADPGRWERERAIADAAPTVLFDFDDFDGERIQATTRIEEREWRFGTGWFKWLSLFRRPRISRSLDIRFSKETGKRKGSWKGGTIGHSIEMLPDELHQDAFTRYCGEHSMAFVGAASSPSKGGADHG